MAPSEPGRRGSDSVWPNPARRTAAWPAQLQIHPWPRPLPWPWPWPWLSAVAVSALLGAAGCKADDPGTTSPWAFDLAGGQAADLAWTPPPDLALGPPGPDSQYNSLVVYQRLADFAGWTWNGTAAQSAPKGDGAAVQLAPSQGTPIPCSSDEIDGGAASYDAKSGLCAGSDPMPSGLPAGVNYYNGGTFYYGTVLSPQIQPEQPIGTIIA